MELILSFKPDPIQSNDQTGSCLAHPTTLHADDRKLEEPPHRVGISYGQVEVTVAAQLDRGNPNWRLGPRME